MRRIAEDTRNTTDRSLSRRRMLKGAAAVGVGAVAWSAPNIKTFGFAPAYAYVCTTPWVTFLLGDRNTDCGNCGDDTIRYKSDKNATSIATSPGDPLPKDSSFGTGGQYTLNFDTPGECPPLETDTPPSTGTTPSTDFAAISINTLPQNFGQCRVLVEVFEQGSTSPCSSTVSVSAMADGDFFYMPTVRCSDGTCGTGSLFTRLSIECNADPTCTIV